jgi:hypothetical protein
MGLEQKQNEEKLGVRSRIERKITVWRNGAYAEAKRGETRRGEQDRKENHRVEE